MIIADLKTPYYAVIFTTVLTNNLADYEKTAIRMEKLAELQEGFLGIGTLCIFVKFKFFSFISYSISK